MKNPATNLDPLWNEFTRELAKNPGKGVKLRNGYFSCPQLNTPEKVHAQETFFAGSHRWSVDGVSLISRSYDMMEFW